MQYSGILNNRLVQYSDGQKQSNHHVFGHTHHFDTIFGNKSDQKSDTPRIPLKPVE